MSCRSVTIFFCVVVVLLSGITSCKKTEEPSSDCVSDEPTLIAIKRPARFPALPDFSSNPITVEGVALGKKLFYDPILSGDGTQSCGSCHNAAFAFTDNGKRYSKGIDGTEGNRNSMALINLIWEKDLFWDGRSKNLIDQAFEPIRNPIEMYSSWPVAVSKLQADASYPDLFCKAFGTRTIDSTLVAKAIAQFESTLISSNSKFDKFVRGEVNLSPSELNGFQIYSTERGDCFHCHNQTDMTFTDRDFHNNGLDETFTDLGLGAITKNPTDNGKFRTPTLRNLVFTAPYMHDGRFNTIEEVVEHYNSGGKPSATVDPLMKKVGVGLNLSPTDKQDLINFLKTLTDSAFVQNPAFKP